MSVTSKDSLCGHLVEYILYLVRHKLIPNLGKGTRPCSRDPRHARSLHEPIEPTEAWQYVVKLGSQDLHKFVAEKD